MKQSKIVIRDAKRKTGKKGFRVESRAKNGELLQISEVLNTPANVKKHIDAMVRCWDAWSNSVSTRIFTDETKDQTFVKKGWAKSGLTSKTK